VEIVAQEMSGGEDGASRIEFAVRDSGRGIPPDKITTLFQPLRKESGRRGQLFSQTGLGLTICRKLATALKSELKVESRIGWGTRFFFDLDMPIVRRGAQARVRRATAAFIPYATAARTRPGTAVRSAAAPSATPRARAPVNPCGG